MWDPYHLTCSLDALNDFWMAMIVKCNTTRFTFGFINFFGPQTIPQKEASWTQVSTWITTHIDIPYILFGDFNVIQSLDEKKGGKGS